MKRTPLLLCLLLAACAFVLTPREPQPDPRLKDAFRRPQADGWIFVHLAGAPRAIGFQHGYLLAREIDDSLRAAAHLLKHDTRRD